MTEARRIAINISRSEHVDFAELDKKLRDEMTPDERENYRLLGELSRVTRVIEATNRATGQRSRFEFAEHYNVGPGWQMWDLNNGKKIVSSFDLVDAEPVISDETKPLRMTDLTQVICSKPLEDAPSIYGGGRGSHQGLFTFSCRANAND